MALIITREEFKITVERSGENVRIHFEGICEFKNPEEIFSSLFNDLFDENFKEFVLCFNRMEFMNSSTIPAILDTISQFESRKTRGVLIYDNEIEWQAKAFGLMKEFVKSKKFRYVIIRPH